MDFGLQARPERDAGPSGDRFSAGAGVLALLAPLCTMRLPLGPATANHVPIFALAFSHVGRVLPLFLWCVAAALLAPAGYRLALGFQLSEPAQASGLHGSDSSVPCLRVWSVPSTGHREAGTFASRAWPSCGTDLTTAGTPLAAPRVPHDTARRQFVVFAHCSAGVFVSAWGLVESQFLN
jgi:hypothetical protein